MSDINILASKAISNLLGNPGDGHIHDATDITQDATHRFVTDAEKTSWDNKAFSSLTGKPTTLAGYGITDAIGSGGAIAFSWTGKKVAFLGDSITAGDGTAKVFHSYMQDTLGIVPLNYGEGGTTVADSPYHNNPMYNRVNNELGRSGAWGNYGPMDATADAIFVFGGTNDWSTGSIPTGDRNTVTADGLYAPTTGTDNFYGAYHLLIQKLLAKYPGKPIVLMTPLHRDVPSDYIQNSSHQHLEDFANAIIELGRFYSLPVIDLYRESGLNPKYNLTQYWFDGTHPNAEGHKIIARTVMGHISPITGAVIGSGGGAPPVIEATVSVEPPVRPGGTTPTAIVMGDSIDQAGSTEPNYRRADWLNIACILSGGTMVRLRNSANAGWTTATMLGAFDDAVIAYKPNYCFIKGGTNDIHFADVYGLTPEDTKANISAMVKKCKDNAIIPILCTLPPRSDYTRDPTIAPTLTADTGGSLTAGTYYVTYAWYNNNGETLVSPEANVTVLAGGTITVTTPAIPTGYADYAEGVNIYIGTTAGTGTRQAHQTTNTYVQTSALVSGAAKPTVGQPPVVANVMKKQLSQNAWLREYAKTAGCMLVDFFSVLVNPATGDWKDNYIYPGDRVHPDFPALMAMGQEVYRVMKPILPPYQSHLSMYHNDPLNMVVNGLMKTDVGDPTFAPTDWTITPSGAGVGVTTWSDVAPFTGRVMVISKDPSPTVTIKQTISTGFAEGDKLVFAGKVKTDFDDPLYGAQWRIKLTFVGAENSGQAYVYSAFDLGLLHVPDGGAWEMPMYVPPLATGIEIEFYVGNGSGVMYLGQITLINLTEAGIAPAFDFPPPPVALPFTDNFNLADAADLAEPWVPYDVYVTGGTTFASGPVAISGNKVASTTYTDGSGFADPNGRIVKTTTTNCIVRAKLKATATSRAFIALRVLDAGRFLYVEVKPATNQIILGGRNNTYIEFSTASITYADYTEVKVELNGTAVKVYYGDTLILDVVQDYSNSHLGFGLGFIGVGASAEDFFIEPLT